MPEVVTNGWIVSAHVDRYTGREESNLFGTK